MKIRVFCTNPDCKYKGKTYYQDEPTSKWCDKCEWPLSYKCPICGTFLKEPSETRKCQECRNFLTLGYAGIHAIGTSNFLRDYEKLGMNCYSEKFLEKVEQTFAPWTNKIIQFWQKDAESILRTILDWAKDSNYLSDIISLIPGYENIPEQKNPHVLSLVEFRKKKDS